MISQNVKISQNHSNYSFSCLSYQLLIYFEKVDMMQGYGPVGLEVVKMTVLNGLDRLICKWLQSGIEESDVLCFVI